MKKKNTKAKGQRIQRKVLDILEADGWQCETARPTYAFICGRAMAIQHDYFSCIDIIALKRQQVRFIQVTVDEEVSRKRKKLKDFAYYQAEIWGYKGGRNRHFRLYEKQNDYAWSGRCEIPIKKERNDKKISR